MGETHFDDSSENLLKQILDVLQNSTIAEERGHDVLSNFWAAYKKVSTEYDSDMLERCNSGMDVLLIFVSVFLFLVPHLTEKLIRLVYSPLSIRRSLSRCSQILLTLPMLY